MTNYIPTFILEESNETFIIWQYAKIKKLINPEGNTLLHIGEHIDMGCPRLKTSIFKLENNISKTIDVCYNEFCINSYIIPAIYQGMFDKVHWLNSPSSKRERLYRKRIVRTYDDEGKKFMVGNPNKQPTRNNSIYRKFILTDDSLCSLKVCNHNNVVLNLNLSYFACVRNPSEYKVNYIEITENEYNQFNENSRYHELRYGLLGNRIETKKELGKYYYVINDHEEVYVDVKRPGKPEIISFIKELVKKLVELNIKFRVITITRSKKSGYTPEDLADFIEQELLTELRKHYNLKVEEVGRFLERVENDTAETV